MSSYQLDQPVITVFLELIASLFKRLLQRDRSNVVFLDPELSRMNTSTSVQLLLRSYWTFLPTVRRMRVAHSLRFSHQSGYPVGHSHGNTSTDLLSGPKRTKWTLPFDAYPLLFEV